jgi:hypothetical protein
MQIKFKWTMQGHFKHIRFKNFLMVSWEPNLVVVYLSNQGSEHSQLCTSVTLKVGMHLGIIGFHLLHSPSFMKVCFTPKHIIDLMGPCNSHLVVNPMLGLWHYQMNPNYAQKVKENISKLLDAQFIFLIEIT